MNEQELIIQKLLLIKPLLSKEYNISSLALFGAIARNEQTPKSDVDLLIDFSITPDLLKFIELEERFKKELGRDVDLVPKRKLRVELSQQIEKEKIAI